jgi:hypothetical protein
MSVKSLEEQRYSQNADFKQDSPAEKPTFWGEPSNVVYSFVLGIK